MEQLDTAVIPIAGYGTRMFPSTLFTNKAMLNIGRKPIILHILEEAYNAGINNFIIIINEHQKNIINLLKLINEVNNQDISSFNNLIKAIKINYVIQKKQNGLGDALLTIENIITSKYFALLLGDTAFIKSNEYGINELKKAFNIKNANYIGLTKVKKDKIKNYGVVITSKIKKELVIKNIIEKPNKYQNSNLICAGRYILNKEIFNALKSVMDSTKELLLPDAINLLSNKENILGVIHTTKWLDVGNELEFIKANFNYGLSKKEYKKELKKLLQK